MSLDLTTLAMVRESARRFAERFRLELNAIEAVNVETADEALHNVMAEAAQLGWHDSLEGAVASEPSDNEAALLAVIACEMGSVAPGWTARWMAHHVARCLENLIANTHIDATRPLELPRTERWLGLDASTIDCRFAAPLCVANDGRELSGTLRFVVGGDYATHWMARGEAENGSRGVVIIDAKWLVSTRVAAKRVATLGLQGLGTVEANLQRVAADGFRWLPSEQLDECVERSRRFAAAATIEMMRTLVEQAKGIALSHASHRRQNGVLLLELPAVQQMIGELDRALTLMDMVRQSAVEQGVMRLLPVLRTAAYRATDASLQVLGGTGYVEGAGAERVWRDVRQLGQLLAPGE